MLEKVTSIQWVVDQIELQLLKQNSNANESYAFCLCMWDKRKKNSASCIAHFLEDSQLFTQVAYKQFSEMKNENEEPKEMGLLFNGLVIVNKEKV